MNDFEDKNKEGRPTKYSKQQKLIAAGFLALNQGASNKDLADALKISLSTLYNWQNEHPEFMESIESVRSSVRQLLVGSAINEAIEGYYYEEALNKHGEIVELRKYKRPNTNMLSLMLLNFAGIRNVVETVNKVELANIDMDKLSIEEAELLNKLIDKAS